MGCSAAPDHPFLLAGSVDARGQNRGVATRGTGAASFLARMSADSAIISVSVRHPRPRLAGPGSPLSRVSATAAVGIFGAVIGAAGCAFEVDVGVEVPNNQLVAVVPDTIRTELDLLFVVDDTEGMAAVHQDLGELWGRMRHHLEYAEGGFPDVRIGIITSDVGVGAAAVPGCTATGRDGALIPWGEQAHYTVDPLALDLADEQIAEQFRQIGESTCEYEQPLAAMQRAMDGAQLQTEFLRDAAALGVVFVAGADDCSVTDPGFFGEDGHFRCFREGVVCGDDAFAAGPQYGCRPRDSSLIANVGDHAKLLLEMKDDSRAIAVGAVLGNPIEVRLEATGPDTLSLAPACADAPGSPGELYPGVRLGAFAQDENLKGSVADLCSQTLADAGSPTALDLRRALGHRCLEGKIADVEPDEPGMQVECAVQTITGVADPVELPPCVNPNRVYESPGPCFAIKAGPSACGDFPSQLAVQVNWGGDDPMTAPADTVTEVRCIVEDGAGPFDDPSNGLPD